MSTETILDALVTRFATEIATGQSIETIYDNQPSSDPPTDGTEFARWTVVPGEGDVIEISSGAGGKVTERERGIAIASFFVPIGSGDERMTQLVDATKTAFRNVTASGVRYLFPYPVRIGESRGMYQWNVVCPWQSDAIGV